jgi:hypothetical protein
MKLVTSQLVFYGMHVHAIHVASTRQVVSACNYFDLSSAGLVRILAEISSVQTDIHARALLSNKSGSLLIYSVLPIVTYHRPFRVGFVLDKVILRQFFFEISVSSHQHYSPNNPYSCFIHSPFTLYHFCIDSILK